MPHACVQRFSGNNFPVTFKRGLRSVEEQRNEAKRSEREREREREFGDVGGCAETWLQSTDQPTRNYATDGVFFPLTPFFPVCPCARSLWRHIKRVRFLSLTFSRHRHRHSPVTQGASGAAKNGPRQFFFIYRDACPVDLTGREERFAILFACVRDSGRCKIFCNHFTKRHAIGKRSPQHLSIFHKM